MGETMAGPSLWVGLFKNGLAALRRGDLSEARGFLAEAQALDLDGVLELRLLQADILGADGQVAGAIAVLQRAAEDFPNNRWPAFKIARLQLEEGDLRGAQLRLAPPLERDVEGRHPELWLLEADIQLKLGNLDKACAALTQLCAKHPAHPPLAQCLSTLARLPGGAERAIGFFQTILAHDGDIAKARFAYARLLMETGKAHDAIDHLKILRRGLGADDRADSEVMITLVQAYRITGQMDCEEACLGEALADDPLNAWLLRHLFGGHAEKTDLKTQQQVLDLVRAKGGGALADDLSRQMLIHTHHYAEALIAIRGVRKTRDTPGDAQQLAAALLGTYRYRLGLRYLRACLRRWPTASGLIGLYVSWGLKLGQINVIAAYLTTIADRLPAYVVHSHQLMLQGFRNDLAGAVERYAKLRSTGHDAAQHRQILAKMIFTLADLDSVETLSERIGNPGAEGPQPMHRGGLPGMMTMELDFERQALAAHGSYETQAEWVRQRAQSPIPAIRLIDAWRAGRVTVTGQGDAIPLRIFQYWDQPKRPGSIDRMCKSWQVAGFEHQLMTRHDALVFLRETFDPDWSRAFQLANNPAEESDLLRLCLLSHFGGVYADADDYLYGDLTKVTDIGGLVVYREPLGGALGNNVIAAPAGHPAVIYAARLVRQAMLQRAAETTWSKTGPGVLTRAVGQYIAQIGPDEARGNLTVLPYVEMARIVGMHNPVRYKATEHYWGNRDSRPPSGLVWEQALKGLG